MNVPLYIALFSLLAIAVSVQGKALEKLRSNEIKPLMKDCKDIEGKKYCKKNKKKCKKDAEVAEKCPRTCGCPPPPPDSEILDAIKDLEAKIDKNADNIDAVFEVLEHLCLFNRPSIDFESEIASVQGKCYAFSNVEKSWNGALTLCKQSGAKLVEPKTISIVNGIADKGVEIMKKNSTFFWMGLTDAATEDEWVYASDGNPVNITNWLPTQPNNDGNCATIGATTDDTNGLWTDFPCGGKLKFICEF